MKKVKVIARAKVNFTLDILGQNNGFHKIKSLVCTIGLNDIVVLKKRNDKKVILTEKGIKTDCPQEKNNAYKAAQAFIKKYDTNGVDIIINKRIPLGGGLGGSSADVSAVLNGMKKLYRIQEDMSELANELGSDTAYMLKGGYAVIEGRGEIITRLPIKTRFYTLLMTADGMVTAGECYKQFDLLGNSFEEITDTAVSLLLAEKTEQFLKVLKNDLYIPATKINPQIAKNLEILNKYGDSIMTGSGSVTLALFNSKKQLNKAYKQLNSKYLGRIIKSKTSI